MKAPMLLLLGFAGVVVGHRIVDVAGRGAVSSAPVAEPRTTATNSGEGLDASVAVSRFEPGDLIYRFVNWPSSSGDIAMGDVLVDVLVIAAGELPPALECSDGETKRIGRIRWDGAVRGIAFCECDGDGGQR